MSQNYFCDLTDTYTVVFENFFVGVVGRYQYQATLLDPPPFAKTGLNTEYSGQFFASPGEYTFSAPAGTPILFTFLDSHHYANIGGGGKRLYEGQSIQAQFVVPLSGTYNISIGRRYNSDNGEPDVNDTQFAFRIVDLSSVPLVQLGQQVNGTLPQPGSVAAYRFQGTAGQRIDLGRPSPNTYLSLTSPLYFFASAPDVVTLPQTGEYFVFVQPNGATSANFSFKLIELPAPTPVALDTTVSGQLTAGSGSRYFQFDAPAGELYFDDLGTSHKIRYRTQLLDGSSQLLPALPTLVEAEGRFTVSNPGRYLLILEADEADRPASYSFKFHSAKSNSIPLTLGQDVTSTFTEPVQANSHTFSGVAGQKLYFNRLDPGNNFASNLQIKLIGPTGELNAELQYNPARRSRNQRI